MAVILGMLRILFSLLLALTGVRLCGQAPAHGIEPSALESPVQKDAEEQSKVAQEAIPSLGKRYWEAAAQQMAEVLTRLGNYTCILHLDRYQRSRRSPLFQKLDSVRLQVTSLEGSEYYSLPGSTRTSTNPRELVATGLVATGIFQGYARAIFQDRGLSNLVFLGADASAASNPLRFRFTFEEERHPLEVRIGDVRALVPGKGMFWADQRDLRVRRIVVENVAPIRKLRVNRILYVMDWAPVKTLSGEFLLPQRVEMSMLFEDGSMSRNEATMAQCREYGAESSIRFDVEEVPEEPSPSAPLLDANSIPAAADGASEAASGVEVSASRFLAGGLRVGIRLRDALPLARMAVGDEFRGTVSKAVLQDGKVLLPEGADVQGRVRRLSESTSKGQPAVAWLEISVIHTGVTEYTFLAELTRWGKLPGLLEKAPDVRRASGPKGANDASVFADFGEAEGAYRAVPGVAALLFETSLGTLPAGYEMEWKTISALP